MENTDELKAKIKYLERKVDRLEDELDGIEESEDTSEASELAIKYRKDILKFLEDMNKAPMIISDGSYKKVITSYDDEFNTIKDFLEKILMAVYA